MTHSQFAMPNLDISSFIRDMPGFVMIKDLDSNYLNANANTINEFGLKNPDHLYGYSDLTIPHPLSQNGQLYRKLDLEVIQTGELMKGICTFPFQDSIRPYHFKKSILKDIAGNSIATFSHAEECTNSTHIQFFHKLIDDHPFKFQTGVPNSFILNKEYGGVNLSLLESNCLFYLIRRKTALEIAKILNFSVNTINLYIANIKTQLNVNNTRDILELSIIKGYLNIVPLGIFNQLFLDQNHSLSSNHIQIINSESKLLHNNIKFNGGVKLTNREFDCAKLLMNGCRIKEIAAIINLSPRTVETHINNLKIKFDCRDKIELIIKLKDMLA